MTRLGAISICALMAISMGASAAATDHPCRSADVAGQPLSAYVDEFLTFIRDLVSKEGNHPEAHAGRLADSLPLLARSEVRLEKSKSVCRSAIAAIDLANKDSIDAGNWKKVGPVIVLRAGDVYVVQDPDQHTGEWVPTYVFDLEFKKLKVVILY